MTNTASTALFWTEISDVVPGIYWNHSSSLGITAHCTPATTAVFISHILFNCSQVPVCLPHLISVLFLPGRLTPSISFLTILHFVVTIWPQLPRLDNFQMFLLLILVV